MAVAGIKMGIFDFITVRGVKEWDIKPNLPLSARLTGGISLARWALVFVFGRWTGFSMLPIERRGRAREARRERAAMDAITDVFYDYISVACLVLAPSATSLGA